MVVLLIAWITIAMVIYEFQQFRMNKKILELKHRIDEIPVCKDHFFLQFNDKMDNDIQLMELEKIVEQCECCYNCPLFLEEHANN